MDEGVLTFTFKSGIFSTNKDTVIRFLCTLQDSSYMRDEEQIRICFV